MPTRLPSLRRPPLGFAHRGARANAPENTLEAFELALRLGATGLESDVWVTADGEAVLDHDGVVRRGLRRHPIRTLVRADLPDHIPSLTDLYRLAGPEVDLSLDVKDADAFERVIEVASAAGDAALGHLWLCHHETAQVIEWRRRQPAVRLVDSTVLGRMEDGPERRAAELATNGIDAVNLHQTDWTGGLVALFHRFGVLCFGWDAQHDRILDGLLDIGVDGVYSDHVDRMVDALARAEAR